MTARSLRGRVAVAGIGQTAFYKHGQSPDAEFKLAARAVLGACEDAGISPVDIDGFASFGNDRNDATRMASALGVRQLRSATMQWGGGGGGCCAAVANAAAAIATGLSDCVVVYRALAQGQFGRFGRSSGVTSMPPDMQYQMPYGVLAPPQKFAMRVMRFMEEHGVKQEALRAIALAANHHAQANPRAVMRGKPLDAARYDASRWIAEPFHLFDCCMENDGAAAIILVPAERAKELAHKPVYLLGAAGGPGFRAGATPHNAPDYASAGYREVAVDLWRMAQLGPQDVGSVQSYANFTGGVAMSLAEHGFFVPAHANEFLTLENLIAPSGKLPVNTSGGNLAEVYLQGFELILEGVRQVRGTSTSQSARSDVALVTGGPMVSPASSLVFGSEAVL
ncbi:MAG: acetyl-CoA acetyltransferase [Devosia sp.]